MGRVGEMEGAGGMTTFRKLKVGDLFFCAGTEYVKVGPSQAIAISPRVVRFDADEQVAKSEQKSTTVGNWRWAGPSRSIKDVRGA